MKQNACMCCHVVAPWVANTYIRIQGQRQCNTTPGCVFGFSYLMLWLYSMSTSVQFFLAQTKMSWRSLLTSQYSR